MVLVEVERPSARRTTCLNPRLVQAFYGPVGGGVGAPCVTWVLDEQRVVGDNDRDRVSPASGEARSRQCYMAVQLASWRACAWQEQTAGGDP